VSWHGTTGSGRLHYPSR